ncbi:MAG TPA: multidrug transporter [Candidatus Caccomorpha excrementavium]|nr:multidrug transporter [Candidatus Caccomorpha excrementavium]
MAKLRDEEDGGIGMIETVIMIGIVIVLAIVFRDAIKDFIERIISNFTNELEGQDVPDIMTT